MIPDQEPVSRPPRPIFTGDEIDLRQVTRALWRYRIPLLLITLVGTLLGGAVSLLSTKYVSQGLFLIPDLTLLEYKQYEALIDNQPRLEQFIKEAGLEGTPTALALHRLVERRDLLAEAVRPVFTVTSKDLRLFDIKSEAAGELVGIQLTLERGKPSGTAPIMALAEYVRSSIVQRDLQEIVISQCLEYQTRETELRNASLQSQFAIRQNETRAARLRELIDKTPGAAEIDNRQVVSLENGGDRFLSPTAQLIAVNVMISELQLGEEQRIRDRLAAILRYDYYCRARGAADLKFFGSGYFKELERLQAEVFKSQDMKMDVVEQTANELEIQRRDWSSKYIDLTRFVVSPEGAERRVRRPPLTLGLVLGFLGGALLALVFGMIAAWWHDHRIEIVSADDAD